jgi:hypothetical protein
LNNAVRLATAVPEPDPRILGALVTRRRLKALTPFVGSHTTYSP